MSFLGSLDNAASKDGKGNAFAYRLQKREPIAALGNVLKIGDKGVHLDHALDIPELKDHPSLLPENQRSKKPCGGCSGKKSFGLRNYASAIASGESPEEDQIKRMDICRSCTAVDLAGDPLYRNIESKVYCGQPRLGWKLFRDEALDGCGCDLEIKVRYNNAECPLKKWLKTGGG